MTRIHRPRLSPAMTVATIALFVALTGGATAATVKLITGAQIKNGSITGADIKNQSLTPADFKGSVQGPQGPAGPAGAPGSSVFDGAIPSGKTVKGVWGGEFRAQPGLEADTYFVSFPIPAPVGLTRATAAFGIKGSNGTVNPTIQSRIPNDFENTACSGTVNEPSAPAGMLCLYVRDSFGPLNVAVNSLTVWPMEPALASASYNKLGFHFQFFAQGAGATRVEGSWAYTAP